MTWNGVTGAPWTDREDRILAAMRLDGYGMTEIAMRVRRTKESVHKRMERLGISGPGWRERARALSITP